MSTFLTNIKTWAVAAYDYLVSFFNAHPKAWAFTLGFLTAIILNILLSLL
jgi:hypothetical protein